jgi:P-type Ca2+ transporter type 2C
MQCCFVKNRFPQGPLMKFYQSCVEEVAAFFATDLERGLSSEQAENLQRLWGPNKIKEISSKPIYKIFLQQFKDPLLFLLVGATCLIILLGYYSDALVICIVLLFNAVLGTIQERRAHTIVEGLKKFSSVSVLVVRDGEIKVVREEVLVPGDIITLQDGDKIPADARIVYAKNLVINESVLTGESAGILKSEQVIKGDHSLFEQNNMLFKGTVVIKGSARALIVATGANTEFGKLQHIFEQHEADMPLKHELERVAHWILVFVGGLCIFLLCLGLFTNKSFSELLLMITALFIAVVPEGLPLVFTLVLAVGARRMAKQHMLVKRLQAAEGLGRIDVIMVDKTGTLTHNEMAVLRVYADDRLYAVSGCGYDPKGHIMCDGTVIETAGNRILDIMRDAAALLDNAQVHTVENGLYAVKGEPTEAAMGIFARKLSGIKSELKKEYNVVHEIPFDFDLRLHIGFYRRDKLLWIFMAGAPEQILGWSLGEHATKELLILDQFLREGLRVVGLAFLTIDFPETVGDWRTYLENFRGEFSFLGFLGIQDAIREDVADAVSKARDAGLSVIMATGDHRATARFVGLRTGIFREGDAIITGEQLHALSSEAQEDLKFDNITLFSRVTPSDKLRIVEILRSQGKRVAMTGDGVNDVPSLVAADIGIAMGMSGTDLAKDAADLILLNDSFSSIIGAIEQGRHILYALRRVILYFFSTNLSEVIVVVAAFVTNVPTPLLASQILWLNLVTDSFLDTALAMEAPEKGLLSKNWLSYNQRRGLVDKALLLHITLVALPMALGTLFVFLKFYSEGLSKARTMCMLCLAMFQWFNAWNCRSETISILRLGCFSNYWLIAATGVVIVLQIAVIYVPLLQALFHTVALSLYDWLYAGSIAVTILIIEELRKWIQNNGLLTVKQR